MRDTLSSKSRGEVALGWEATNPDTHTGLFKREVFTLAAQRFLLLKVILMINCCLPLSFPALESEPSLRTTYNVTRGWLLRGIRTEYLYFFRVWPSSLLASSHVALRPSLFDVAEHARSLFLPVGLRACAFFRVKNTWNSACAIPRERE